MVLINSNASSGESCSGLIFCLLNMGATKINAKLKTEKMIINNIAMDSKINGTHIFKLRFHVHEPLSSIVLISSSINFAPKQ
jgi:hypothetical protein